MSNQQNNLFEENHRSLTLPATVDDFGTEMKLILLGEPTPKQSARFRIVQPKGKKAYVQAYQPKEIVDKEMSIKEAVINQLPPDFIPFDGAVSMGAKLVFGIPKSFSKKKRKAIEDGATHYKITKPDLQDNLMKGICDAMESIVYTNDSRICKTTGTEKIYGFKPRIEITIAEIPQVCYD